MADYSLGYLVVSQMKDSIESYMETAFQLLASEAIPAFRLVIILAIVILGICVILGKFKEGTQEVISIIIITPFILEVVSNYDYFFTFFIDPAVDITKGLMGMFVSLKVSSGDPLAEMFVTMDEKFIMIFAAVEIAADSGGFLDGASIWIVSLVLALLYGLLYIVFTTLVIYGLFAFYIYAVLAPLALLFASMSKTRFIFWAWFRQVCNYLLIPVITSIVMGITVNVLGVSADVIAEMDIEESGVWNKEIGLAFLIGSISFFFHLKAPELANGLAGGQAGGVGGFFAGFGAMAMGANMLYKQTGISKGVSVINKGAGRAISSGVDAAGSRYGGRAYSALKGVFTK